MRVSLASGTATLTNPTVEKSGNYDGGDNCNFYGINSAVLAVGGGNVTVEGGSYTSSGLSAPPLFISLLILK